MAGTFFVRRRREALLFPLKKASEDDDRSACDPAQDFLDCTDGWRCGATGRCLDPIGEALENLDGGVGAASIIRNRSGPSTKTSARIGIAMV